jgi:hypothetical protein
MTKRQIQGPGGQQTFGRFARKIGAGSAFTAILTAGLLLLSSTSRAGKDDDDEASKIRVGFAVAPVPLNLAKKNYELVGLGSYIVNVQADCNGCHTASPATEYTGNPVLFAPPSLTVHQMKKVNPATYLGGGQDFGAYPAPNSPLHIFSRNLTPDNTGRPEGGNTFSQFLHIIRTGKDFDLIHPSCPTSTQTATCLPYPFDGALLQIMPWPAFQNMSDHEIQAIYEYLSAVPCIDTVVAGQPQLRNTCNK